MDITDGGKAATEPLTNAEVLDELAAKMAVASDYVQLKRIADESRGLVQKRGVQESANQLLNENMTRFRDAALRSEKAVAMCWTDTSMVGLNGFEEPDQLYYGGCGRLRRSDTRTPDEQIDEIVDQSLKLADNGCRGGVYAGGPIEVISVFDVASSAEPGSDPDIVVMWRVPIKVREA